MYCTTSLKDKNVNDGISIFCSYPRKGFLDHPKLSAYLPFHKIIPTNNIERDRGHGHIEVELVS